MDDDDVIRLDLIVRADRGDRVARVVHVGQRLGEEELDVATLQIHRALAEHREPLVVGKGDGPAFGQYVGGHEAHVVPRVLIFFAGVAQPHDQPEIGCHVLLSCLQP